MQVDLGDGVCQMKLLGDEDFFCQTEKEIRVYNLNQVSDIQAVTLKQPDIVFMLPDVNRRPETIFYAVQNC